MDDVAETRGNTFELAAGAARAVVDGAAGGRIAELAIDGLSLLVARCDDPLAWGSYPMAPWTGRVRNGRFVFGGREHRLPLGLPPHAIHGTTFQRPWIRTGDTRLEIDLGADWPWRGRAVQELSLREEGLEMRLEVHSERDAFPATLGWHPWFRRDLGRGGTAELAFEAGAMYACDDAGIPTGARVAPPPGPWDDCFTDVRTPPVIRWPGALRLELESSADHWVVYSRPRHALCVEPMTGPPDALNRGAPLVEPGRPLVATARLRWRLEGPEPQAR